MKIYITGIGVVSAIGMNVKENYLSLQSGKSGIEKIRMLQYDDDILAGEVRLSNRELAEKFDVSDKCISRTSLLGIASASEAWGKNSFRKDIRTGIISATTVGGMDHTEKYYRQVLQKEEADISLITTHDSGNTTEKIARHFGFSGYVNTISTACSSAANAMMLGARMIEQGRLDRVLVGGADALTAFTIKGFHSLMIYDKEYCKPFDENRNGLNLGEGAAFLVLENESSISKSGNEPYCLISGWHNAADAYHQTASSPDGKGATLAMQGALKKTGLVPGEISYINAHGTGTKNNDLSESVAIKNIFGDHIPAFSSTKAFTGHTLAAAGAIEAVYSVLAIKYQVIFPNLNFSTPVSETGLIPQAVIKQAENMQAVMSNSFGFGGNNTSLIFNKI